MGAAAAFFGFAWALPLPFQFCMGATALLEKPFMEIGVKKSTNWYVSLPAQFMQ